MHPLFRFVPLFAVACTLRAAEINHAANFAARLTIDDIRIAPTYGLNHAASGKQFVILAAKWEDIIDAKLAGERELPLAYGIPELGQHLYLVVDGGELGLLHGDWEDGAGRKSFSGLTLAKPGDAVAGDLVFEIRAGAGKSLCLRFYDDTAGDIAMTLRGVPPETKPLVPVQKNAVSEFAVFEVSDLGGKNVPAGFRAVQVDLRARSVWRHEVQAVGFEPAHPPGENVSRPNLLNWTEVPKYLHVLAEGDYAYPPVGDGVPESAWFIPEFFTGFRAVFFVPADARALRLVCAMPHAATDTETLNLAPMTFALPPTPAAMSIRSIVPSKEKPLVTIQDDMFGVSLTKLALTGRFAGADAGEGQQFLVLNFSVQNSGKTGEFFQPAEQLFAIGVDGSEIPIDDATAQGPHRPESQIHFPAGARRQFEVVFRIPKNTPLKLSYHGGDFQKIYDLPAASAASP